MLAQTEASHLFIGELLVDDTVLDRIGTLVVPAYFRPAANEISGDGSNYLARYNVPTVHTGPPEAPHFAKREPTPSEVAAAQLATEKELERRLAEQQRRAEPNQTGTNNQSS